MSFPGQVRAENDDNIILQVICQEPEGPVLRTVRQMIFTAENLNKLWEKVKEFPTLYGIDVAENPEVLLEHLIKMHGNTPITDGLFFVVDDFVGLFTLNNIVPDEEADIHYSFFDRRHKGRVDLIRCMLVWAFETFKFHRLSTRIPVYVQPTVFKFVTQDLGFRYEGKKDSAVSYNGKRWPVNLYGILKEDLNG